MAKVLNKYGYPIDLVAKDGESCQIPVGESRVQDKFCSNVPPKVKILSLDAPVATTPKKAVVSEAPKKEEKKEEKENKKGGNN